MASTYNEEGKEDIAADQRKIDRERKEKKKNWQFVIKMVERDEIASAKHMIKKELTELQKLLTHEENEIIHKDEQARYNEYLKSDEKTRCSRWYFGKNL